MISRRVRVESVAVSSIVFVIFVRHKQGTSTIEVDYHLHFENCCVAAAAEQEIKPRKSRTLLCGKQKPT
jgi:hypothetical protein